MEIKAVKNSLGRIVLHKPSGIRYRFTAYIFRRHKTGFLYQAELEDLTAPRSVRVCKLEDIEILEE